MKNIGEQNRHSVEALLKYNQAKQVICVQI